MGDQEKKEDLVELSEHEKGRKERGLKAKEFLQSEFFTKYLLPFIDKTRFSEYPDPGETGWEDKYRVAFAKDFVFTKFLQDIQSWTKEYEDLANKEGKVKKDIINA